MAKDITVRLDEADYAALAKQAKVLRLRPGTLARNLVSADLRSERSGGENMSALAALERLARRSRVRASADGNCQNLWIGVSCDLLVTSGLVGSFDELAVDEGGAGADERDEVRCVDRTPAGLC